MGSRTKPQLAVMAVLCGIDVAGIVLILSGHAVGQLAVGLGVVANGPYILWMRRDQPTAESSPR